MGLESVELVVEWEREFGISIPDEKCVNFRTPQVTAIEISSILSAEGRDMDLSEIHRIIKDVTLAVSGLPVDKYDRTSGSSRISESIRFRTGSSETDGRKKTPFPFPERAFESEWGMIS